MCVDPPPPLRSLFDKILEELELVLLFIEVLS